MKTILAMLVVLALAGCGKEGALLPPTPASSTGNLFAPTNFDVTGCPTGTTLLKVKTWFGYSCYCYSPGGTDPSIKCP